MPIRFLNKMLSCKEKKPHERKHPVSSICFFCHSFFFWYHKKNLMSSVLSMKFTVACAKAYLQEMEMHILATCKFRLGRYLPALIPASLLRTEKSKPSHCHWIQMTISFLLTSDSPRDQAGLFFQSCWGQACWTDYRSAIHHFPQSSPSPWACRWHILIYWIEGTKRQKSGPIW